MGGGRVCLGIVVGAHGVDGLIRVKSFTADADDIAAYGPVTDETGTRRLRLAVAGHVHGAVLVRLEGVTTRDEAQALRGMRLYVSRDVLPTLEDEEEYYYADLVGLAAENPQGTALGCVKAIHNFGAGDVIELQGEKGALLLPFTREVVPVVDLAGGRLVVNPPRELIVGQDEDEAEKAEKSDACED